MEQENRKLRMQLMQTQLTFNSAMEEARRLLSQGVQPCLFGPPSFALIPWSS